VNTVAFCVTPAALIIAFAAALIDTFCATETEEQQ
jgi:hypothetical protein